MGRDAVHHQSHRVLADAIMQVAAGAVLRREGVEVTLVLRRSLQAGGAREQFGDRVGERADVLRGDLDARARLDAAEEAGRGGHPLRKDRVSFTGVLCSSAGLGWTECSPALKLPAALPRKPRATPAWRNKRRRRSPLW